MLREPLRAAASGMLQRCRSSDLAKSVDALHGNRAHLVWQLVLFLSAAAGLPRWPGAPAAGRHFRGLDCRCGIAEPGARWRGGYEQAQYRGVVEGWGRVVEHEKGFRALYMRPLALSAMFPIDLKLLEDMAAAYQIRLLISAGEVRRAFPPLTTGAPS